jgi:hypothetical protein
MKIHYLINDEEADNVRELAKSVGLDQLNYDKEYSIYKTAVLQPFYPLEEPLFTGRGNILLIGMNNFVWIHIANFNNWFKTSPISSCEKQKDVFIIKTANSIYELREFK